VDVLHLRLGERRSECVASACSLLVVRRGRELERHEPMS
jgi:hypothetical protein